MAVENERWALEQVALLGDDNPAHIRREFIERGVRVIVALAEIRKVSILVCTDDDCFQFGQTVDCSTGPIVHST